MTRTVFLLFISFIATGLTRAQTLGKFISPDFNQQLCTAMTKALASYNENASMSTIHVFTKDHEAYLRKTVQEVKAAYPDLTEIEIYKKLYISAYHTLVDTCPALDVLITNMYGPCPRPNKMLNMVVEESNTFITKRMASGMNYVQLNEEYSSFLSKFVFENETTLIKDYPDMEDWISDMESYLFHKSKPYFKMILGYLVDSQTAE